MWTIIKSILRFFKTSKSSIIGLFLLIFLSSSIFTLLNHVKTNLQNSYNNISQKGNLHDFVINEHYDIGSGEFASQVIKEYDSNDPNSTKEIIILPVNITYDSQSDNLVGTPNWFGGMLKVFEKYRNNKLIREKYFQKKISIKNGDDENLIVENEINKLKSDIHQFVKNEIPIIFNEQLNNIGVETRQFKALDVKNNKQNIFYKIIESEQNYNIDKLVIYSGNNLTKSLNIYDELSSGLVESFVDTTNENNKKIIDKKTRSLTKILSLSKWSNSTTQFIKLNDYFEKNPTVNSYFDTISKPNDLKTASNHVKKFIDALANKSATNSKYYINNNKYKVVFEFTSGLVPISGVYQDFSSYEIVISDDYALKHNKKPIDYNYWKSNFKLNQSQFDHFVDNLPYENKIQVDNNWFVIVGTGVSPDFMYPIVSFESIIPNRNEEQIVYVNSSGYERNYEGFKGNNQEEFIVGKFPSYYTNEQKNNKLREINNLSKSYMSWPGNVDAAYMYYDTTNTINPTALRVQFIPQIVSITNIISIFMTSFVLFLSVFISIVIVKKFIDTNRNSLGILQANGYKKREIIFGINIFTCIPILIGTILGYLIGLFLQQPAVNLLGPFWTIPTHFIEFSIIHFSIICFGMILLFIIIITIFSLIVLSKPTVEFMKEEAKYKVSLLARYAKKPFKKFGIITRFRTSIAFNSFINLIVLSIMSSCLMISLSFSFAAINKYDEALNSSMYTKRYDYSIKMITPTIQGGQYYAIPYSNQGMTIKNDIYYNHSKLSSLTEDKILTNQYYAPLATKEPYNKISDNLLKQMIIDNGNFQAESSHENNRIDSQIRYLYNQSTTKLLMSQNLGMLGIKVNPWDIAANMMPSNNLAYANNAYNQLLSTALTDSESIVENLNISLNNEVIQSPKYEDLMEHFTKVINENELTSSSFIVGYENNSPIYRDFDSSKTISGLKLNDYFLRFALDLMLNEKYQDFNYNINYNKVIIDPKYDSPFSYLEFNLKAVNDNIISSTDLLLANGIRKDFDFVDLRNDKNEKINYKLELIDRDIIPIIPNKFAQKKYDLKIGDTIEVEILNSTDRFSRKAFNIQNPIAKLKVVDFATTYQNSEFFMSQYDVNKITGMTINNKSPSLPKTKSDMKEIVSWINGVDSKEKFNPLISGFNGIYSSSNSSGNIKSINGAPRQILNGVSLYSPSGLYPAVDKFDSTTRLVKIFDGKDTENNNKPNKEAISEIVGFIEPNIDTKKMINELKNIFGESIQYSIVSSIDHIDSINSVFSNVIGISSNIQNVIVSVIIIISLIIVTIISILIIKDSIKLASVLKCLGYSDIQNALSFLSIYTPVLIIGLILAIPISYFVNNLYVNLVFNFANILLSINMVWWHYLLSFGIVMVIFFISYLICWYKMSRINLRQSIK